MRAPLLAIAIALAAPAAHAARPFVTDDARLVDEGGCQVEIFYKRQRKDKPTYHTGLRFWFVPNRMQLDATVGVQHATPFDRRFGSVGLRILW